MSISVTKILSSVELKAITKMKLWSLRSAYNNYEIIVVTA